MRGLHNHMGGSELVQSWTPAEVNHSSTWRELRALEIFLSVHSHVLEGQQTLWYTDNLAATSISKKGSMNLELNNLAFSIQKMCMIYSINLCVAWLPREENTAADFLS